MSPLKSQAVLAPQADPGPVLKVIGLMSGTSMDGIDAAYLETDGQMVIRPGEAVSISFENTFRRRLMDFVAAAPERNDPNAARVEAEMTDLHAEAVRALVGRMGAKLADIDLIGFHGQTVWHRPAKGDTWQMGDGQRLARALNVPVAYDFRTADVRAGGQGAPLLPIYHLALAGDRPSAILNIGGVANLTWMDQATGSLIGFDTGPGNGLLDDWVKTRLGLPMDGDGSIAAAGKVDEGILCQLLAHPYFTAPAPKSLDRYAFSTAPVAHLSTEDGAATLTAFTAAAVRKALDICVNCPDRLLVAGGGRHNPTMMKEIARYSGIDIAPVETLGWQGDAIEAQGFAYMAVRCLRDLPITFPGTTGVRQPLCGGRIVKP